VIEKNRRHDTQTVIVLLLLLLLLGGGRPLPAITGMLFPKG
jgi:hypothetical protein